jgi:hypothetical protein
MSGMCCCAIVAQSKDMAMKFSKLLSKVNPCECSRMIEEKGIVVGPKCPTVKKNGFRYKCVFETVLGKQRHLD